LNPSFEVDIAEESAITAVTGFSWAGKEGASGHGSRLAELRDPVEALDLRLAACLPSQEDWLLITPTKAL